VSHPVASFVAVHHLMFPGIGVATRDRAMSARRWRALGELRDFLLKDRPSEVIWWSPRAPVSRHSAADHLLERLAGDVVVRRFPATVPNENLNRPFAARLNASFAGIHCADLRAASLLAQVRWLNAPIAQSAIHACSGTAGHPSERELDAVTTAVSHAAIRSGTALVLGEWSAVRALALRTVRQCLALALSPTGAELPEQVSAR
jgi:hypothetical protein